jgi:two-component system sensor histidine kinase QseC
MIDSIKRFLLINLLIAMTVASSLTMVGNYVLEHRDIQRHLDNRLQQSTRFVSETLSDKIEKSSIDDIQSSIAKTLKNSTDGKEDNNFLLQVFDKNNQLILHSPTAPEAPLTEKDNQLVKVTINNKHWQAYSAYNSDLQLRVITAEPDIFQKTLETHIIGDNLFVLLWIYPVLGLLIWFVVNRGFKHLKILSENLSNRETMDFSHIYLKKMPVELQPLVVELNKLFDRLQDAFERNKNFSSDAAHELRTPLAALKTQAQVALLANNDEERKRASEKLIYGVNRCTHIIQQLLTLSRLGHSEQLKDMKPLSLSSVASEIIAQLVPSAIKKNIEIELDAPEKKVMILGNEISVGILIQNLIDNAIRYTPDDGRVIAKIIDDSVHGEITFRVTDTGMGIPKELHRRVFQRFYRVLGTQTSGSGLGLSIVKHIAELHQAEIKLAKPDAHQGLQIDIIFPAIK